MSDEFEAAYQYDFNNSKHIEVNNVLYFDTEENEYVRANIELFGKSSRLSTFDKDNELWKSVRSTTRGENLSPVVHGIEDGLIKLELNNMILLTTNVSYTDIKEYYDVISAEHIKNMKKIAERVVCKANELLLDEELVTMIENSLEDIPIDLFLKPIFICQIEAYLSNKYKNCGEAFLLYSDEITRAHHSRIVCKKVGSSIYTRFVLDNEELILSYFINYFDLLLDIIKEREYNAPSCQDRISRKLS